MIKCNLVNDLLPLYAEGLLSEESRQFVEQHLLICPECAKKAEKLSAPLPEETLEQAMPSPEDKKASKAIKYINVKFRFKTLWVTLASVILCAIIVFCASYFPSQVNYLYNPATTKSENSYRKILMPEIVITRDKSKEAIRFPQANETEYLPNESISVKLEYTIPEGYAEVSREVKSLNYHLQLQAKHILAFIDFYMKDEAFDGRDLFFLDTAYPYVYKALKEKGGRIFYTTVKEFVLRYDLDKVNIFSPREEIELAREVRLLSLRFASNYNINQHIPEEIYPISGDVEGYAIRAEYSYTKADNSEHKDITWKIVLHGTHDSEICTITIRTIYDNNEWQGDIGSTQESVVNYLSTLRVW